MKKTLGLLLLLVSLLSISSCDAPIGYISGSVIGEDYPAEIGYLCKIKQDVDDVVIDVWHYVNHIESQLENDDLCLRSEYNLKLEPSEEYFDHRMCCQIIKYPKQNATTENNSNATPEELKWEERAFEEDSLTLFSMGDNSYIRTYTLEDYLDKTKAPFNNEIHNKDIHESDIYHSEQFRLNRDFFDEESGSFYIRIRKLTKFLDTGIIRIHYGGEIKIYYEINGDTIKFSKLKKN